MKLHAFVFLGLILFSCGKKPLTEPFTRVYGSFEWKQTTYRENASSELQTINATGHQFTAKVVFSDDFMVRLYINDIELASGKFRVLSRTQNGDDFEMRLRVRYKGELDLGNELRVSMFGNDSLFLYNFPYPGYSELNGVAHVNFFKRQ
jgi:hypothetical protein